MSKSIEISLRHRQIFIELAKEFGFKGSDLARKSGLTAMKISRFMSESQDLTHGDFMHLLGSLPASFQSRYHRTYFGAGDIERMAIARAREILLEVERDLRKNEKKLSAPNPNRRDTVEENGLGAQSMSNWIELEPQERRRLAAWIEAAAQIEFESLDEFCQRLVPDDADFRAALVNLKFFEHDLKKEVLAFLSGHLPNLQGWAGDEPLISPGFWDGSVESLLAQLKRVNESTTRR